MGHYASSSLSPFFLGRYALVFAHFVRCSALSCLCDLCNCLHNRPCNRLSNKFSTHIASASQTMGTSTTLQPPRVISTPASTTVYAVTTATNFLHVCVYRRWRLHRQRLRGVRRPRRGSRLHGHELRLELLLRWHRLVTSSNFVSLRKALEESRSCLGPCSLTSVKEGCRGKWLVPSIQELWILTS